MAVKNAIYQVDNGTGFDEIHFKTKAEQVYMTDGKTVEVSLSNKASKSIVTGTLTLVNGIRGVANYSMDDLGYVSIELGLSKSGTADDITGDIIICTIPQQLRPKTDKYFSLFGVRKDASSYLVRLYVQTNGNVLILSIGTAVKNIQDTVMYSLKY